MNRNSRLHALAGVTLSLGLLATLPGCGGGGTNSGGSSGGGSKGGSSTGGTQATSYAEAVALADGQTGALTLTASGGNATGTLTVAAATANAKPYTVSPHVTGTIPAGAYPVSGTLAGGTFTLTGTISGAAFTLSVTLPSGSTSGTFSLVTGGATYAGTVTTATTGTIGAGHILFVASPGSGGDFTAGRSDVFSMNPDGTGVNQVTHLGADSVEFLTFSPDRSKVLFTTDNSESGKSQIYMMNSDGSGLTNFTGRAGGDSVGSFSPDGSRVVFSSNRDNGDPGRSDLYVASADGSNVRRLTSVSDIKIYGYFTRTGVIVYEDASGDYQINADGTGNTQISTQALYTLLAVQYQPWTAFSPDGSKLVTEQTPNGQAGYEVYVSNADGSDPVQRTQLNFQYAGQTPTFSPDGSKIVFDAEPSSGNNMNSDVYLVDGSGLRDLTNTPNTFEVAPIWVQ